MAGRKSRTSKTEHVLNLLTGAGGAPAPAAPAPAETPPPVQTAPAPDGEHAPEAAAPPRESVRRMAAPILEVARANSEALEESIHSALEQALESELMEAVQSEPEPVRPEEPAPEPPVEEMQPEPVQEAPAALLDPEPEEPDRTEAAQAPAESEPEPEAEREPEPVPQPGPDIPTEAGESSGLLPDGTLCVNVMQALVEEKAERYIRMFGLCTCPRCVADVKALALTSLPAKYVVLKETAMRPMISLYRARYDAPVTAQLLSACKQVMDQPRHGEISRE